MCQKRRNITTGLDNKQLRTNATLSIENRSHLYLQLSNSKAYNFMHDFSDNYNAV